MSNDNDQMLAVLDAIEKSVDTLASMCQTIKAYTQSMKALATPMTEPSPSELREAILSNVETMGQTSDD